MPRNAAHVNVGFVDEMATGNSPVTAHAVQESETKATLPPTQDAPSPASPPPQAAVKVTPESEEEGPAAEPAPIKLEAEEQPEPLPEKRKTDFKGLALKILPYVILAVLLGLAFHVRIQPYLNGVKYLNLDDPHYMYKMADFVAKNKYLPAIDYQSYYPVGRPLYLRHDQALLYWLVAIITWIGQLFIQGFGAYAATMFESPITGALQVIPMFFLVLLLTKKRFAALFAAALYAVLPASLSRTLSSFAYKEGFGLLFMLAGLCFLVRAHEKKSLPLSIVSGLLLAIMGYTWNGVMIPVFFLILLSTLLIILDKIKGVELLLIPAAMAIFGGIMVPPYIYNQTLFKLLLIPAALYILKRKFKEKINVTAVIIIFLFVASIVAPTFVFSLWNRFQNFDIGASSAGLASTVAQNKLSETWEFYEKLGLGSELPKKYLGAIVLSVIACIILAVTVLWRFFTKLKKRKFSKSESVWKCFETSISFSEIFIFCFVPFGLWFGGGAVRLLVATAVPVCIGAGYLLAWAWEHLPRLLKSKGGIKLRHAKIALLVIALLLVNMHVQQGYAYAQRVGSSMHPDWIEGLEWIKDNTPMDSKVWSWWDYGYVIQAIANRTSIVDPRNLFEYRNIEAALVFTSKEENQTLYYEDGRPLGNGKYNISYDSSLDYMDYYNVSYVILDYQMIGKYSAVSKIANHGKYIDVIGQHGLTAPGQYGQFMVGGSGNSQIAYYLGSGGSRIPVQNVCTKQDVLRVSDEGLPGCAYIYGNMLFYVNWRQVRNEDGETYTAVPSESSMKSIFVKLWFDDAQSLEHFELVHTSPSGFVKVYKVVY